MHLRTANGCSCTWIAAVRASRWHIESNEILKDYDPIQAALLCCHRYKAYEMESLRIRKENATNGCILYS